MKKQIQTVRIKMAKIVVFTMACFITMPVLHAQTVLSSIQVNTANYTKTSLDGGAKSIAVLNDTVYAVWEGQRGTVSNIYFSKKTDGETSFSGDLNISGGPDSIIHMMPSIAVAESGNIYVAWTAISNNESYWNIWFSKSTDGGNTFQTPQHLSTSNVLFYPSVGAFNDMVYIFYPDAANYPMADYYIMRSANSGTSFENPIKVNDAPCLGAIEFSETSTIAVDSSGNVYLAWVDGRRANGNGDIFMAKSTNNGESFSTNVMVNDINQSGADSIQYSPSIAVDGSDNVYVSFIDKRLGSDDWTKRRVYITKSTDGGSTFIPEVLFAGRDEAMTGHNIAVTPSGKLYAALGTLANTNWGIWLFESAEGDLAFSSPVAMNDNSDENFSNVRIVLNSNQEVLALWQEDHEGSQNIYFSRTDIDTKIAETTMGNEYFLYPNPTSGLVFIKTPISDKDIEITVCNLNGQMIYNKSYTNTSNISLDLEMSKGFYFVNIKSKNGTKTIKLIKE
ncbi:MAG: T9SS type A sorting domain-containing protein [Prolixibacteraceae bacterium]|nr:T9SS type A sorting domain-containing protein [Prolixibacteraceae bacterium]